MILILCSYFVENSIFVVYSMQMKLLKTMVGKNSINNFSCFVFVFVFQQIRQCKNYS